MSNEIKKQMSDEEVKEYMIQNQFDNLSILDILQGMTVGMITKFGHDFVVRNVHRSWENMTGSDIDDLKDQIVNRIKANAKNAKPDKSSD
tara:strand:+ start:1278 stop:1547 length:270 start_codon:yes stop_codon:yes gene_type:complete